MRSQKKTAEQLKKYAAPLRAFPDVHLPKVKTYTLKAVVSQPYVPEHLTSKIGTGVFPLWAFSEEDIVSIGNAWAAALLEKWREQKSAQSKEAQIAHIRKTNDI